MADLQNAALSDFLIFFRAHSLSSYAAVPRPWNLSVIDDQAAAGIIMWVPGSVIFLVPVGLLVIRLLEAPRTGRARFSYP